MAAREFHCEIKNNGQGPIEWVKDGLDHGVWGGRLPSQSTGVIKPGETAGYDAESGGDIPIIGNICTGTEGWVLFKTRSSYGATEYIHVKHNVPYFQVDVREARCSVNVYRYDPTLEPEKTEFDDRDKERPETRVVRGVSASGTDGQGPMFLQDAPWTLTAFFTSFFHRASYRPVLSFDFSVSGNGVPPDNKFPETKPQAFNPSFSVKRNSTPQNWFGAWEGQRLQAWIDLQDDDSLLVQTRDKSNGDTRRQTVNIDRLLLSYEKNTPARVLNRFPDSLTDATVRRRRFALGGSEDINVLSDADKGHLKMHPLINAVKLIQGDEQKPLGGDFLSLSDGSCLEIFLMKQNGGSLGYALRYTSATLGGVPVAAAGAYQEYCYPMASIK